MKLRFSIRDLSWLLIVLALGLLLSLEHSWRVRLDNENKTLLSFAKGWQEHANRWESYVDRLEAENEQLKKDSAK